MGKARAIVASYVGVLAFGAVVFIAGGRLVYWQAWLYMGLSVFGTLITHILTPADSELTSERAQRAKDGELWDRKLLGFLFLASLCSFIVAGLDSGRFGWSGEPPVAIAVVGTVFMIGGQILFALARRENAFFSSTVRIETKRVHTVCETGPYHFVRHPGYLGMMLSNAGFPLVMASYWAFLPVFIVILLLVVRAHREDRFLFRSLDGYDDYSTRVRYRLFPGLY